MDELTDLFVRLFNSAEDAKEQDRIMQLYYGLQSKLDSAIDDYIKKRLEQHLNSFNFETKTYLNGRMI